MIDFGVPLEGVPRKPQVREARIDEMGRHTLVLGKQGWLAPSLFNAKTILACKADHPHPDFGQDNPWGGVFRFDAFRQQIAIDRDPPFPLPSDWSGDRRYLTPEIVLWATEWLPERGMSVTPKTVSQAIESVARVNTYHPVRDWLEGLPDWDGEARLPGLLATYFGAEDTALHDAYAERTLFAAVARIMEPGCKVDTVLVLEGPQGVGKSTALRTLFGSWHTDDLPEFGSRDAAVLSSGAWCIELSELAAIGRTELEKMKSFITRRVDRYRALYTDISREVPRQCTYIGTTNSGQYLRDETGARRFWPVQVGKIDLEALRRDREQLFAEALALCRAGRTWHLDTPDLLSASAEAAEQRMEQDPWYEAVVTLIQDKGRVTIDEVLDHLSLPLHQRNQLSQKRVGAILRQIGWQKRRRHDENKKPKWYFLPKDAQ